MGCVYFMKRANEDVFRISSTDDLEERTRSHSTTDPWLTLYKAIDTEEYKDCETFLHRYFEGRRVRGEYFRFAPEEFEDVIAAAGSFLSQFVPMEKAAKQLGGQQNEPRVVNPSDREREIYRELREVREQEFRLMMRRELLENELKVVIGTAAGLLGIASWKSHKQRTFDHAKFKVENPSMFRDYLCEKLKRRLLLVYE
ncbi:MAG TPA: GIY-YIG nuclease family protein [Candidatus Limnocylindrales bacterium]|nr:GIY-YIG nuclease family protein [Candidatus Limnocylindrales bacterium]